MKSSKGFKVVLILFIVMSLSIFFLSSKSFAEGKTGWEQVGGKWYYYKDGNKVYGRQEIDGKYYCLDSYGAMYTGWYNSGTNELPNWYYYDPNAGGAATVGWKKISGVWYYFSEESYNAGLMSRNGATKIGNNMYVFDKDGHLVEKSSDGWYSLTTTYGNNTETSWYYLKGNGSNTTAYTGWKKLSGVWYYLSTYDGTMATDVDFDENEVYWVFDKSGKWLENVSGWYEERKSFYEDSGKKYSYSNWYYIVNQHPISNQWKTINGVEYYFDNWGVMATAPVVDENGKIWVVDKSGAYIKNPKDGWLETEFNWYWIENHEIYTGWKQIKGVWYYFDTYNGTMYSNGARNIDGKYYYFQESGAMISEGWVKSSYTYLCGDKNVTAYSVSYHDKSGAKVDKKSVWAYVDGDWFYVNAYGTTVKSTCMKIGNAYYGFDETGKCLMKKGWNDYLSTKWDTNANKSVSTTLWCYVEGNNGELATNRWVGSDRSGWYYLSSLGTMLFDNTLWSAKDDCTYGFDSNGLMIRNGWSKRYGTVDYSFWYYFGNDGKSLTNQWKKSGNDWYYFEYSGQTVYCTTKWIDENLYAFGNDSKLCTKVGWGYFFGFDGVSRNFYVTNNDGVLLYDKGVKHGDYWCYIGFNGIEVVNTFTYVDNWDGYFAFNKLGIMIENDWYKIENGTTKWVYLGDGGYAVKGWKKIDGKTYYFDDNYYMVTGEKDINGQHYTFDENGILTSGNSPIANTSLEPSNAIIKDINTIGNSMFEEETVVDEKLLVETEPEKVVVNEVENEAEVVTEDNTTEATEEVTNEVIEDVSEDEILDSDEEAEIILEVTEDETTNTVENEAIAEDATENAVTENTVVE